MLIVHKSAWFDLQFIVDYYILQYNSAHRVCLHAFTAALVWDAPTYLPPASLCMCCIQKGSGEAAPGVPHTLKDTKNQGL